MEAKSRLWQHQIESVRFALGRGASGIFSGMGSGKTRVAIEVARSETCSTVLIVVPKSVLLDKVWPQQLEKYYDRAYQVLTLDSGSTASKATLLKEWLAKGPKGLTLFVIINYDSVWRAPIGDMIMKTKWDMVILDEAHRIKAAGSKISRFMGRLGTKPTVKKKLALTGTPTPNSPLDAYGLFRFLDPTIFGTNYANFSNQYAVFGGFNNYQILRYRNLDDLRSKMSSISIRFETKDVIDLPEIMDINRSCELSEEARKLYNTLEKEFAAEVGDSLITASTVLVKGIRLRQITGGFAKTDTGDLVRVSEDKANLLGEIIEEFPTNFTDTKIGREPVIVFCQFRADIAAALKVLADHDYIAGELSGSVNNLREWHKGYIDALVIQTSAGSEGIDLTRAAYAIYYSPCWDLGEFDQSRARLHRPGQTRPTRFIHMIARNTIDEVMVKALRNKQNVSEYVMEIYRRNGK